MNRTRLIFSCVLVLCCLGASAQSVLRYDNVSERNFGLQGSNVTLMRGLDSVSISYARIGGNYATGQNRLLSDAPRQWSAGAEAETIMHLKKMSMTGSFGFRQTMSYDACGSMFTSPGRFPVDLIEFTPGRKSRQDYFFTGGISVDLNPSWRLGGDIAFAATNYAKLKDLRYMDYAMDFSVRPGAQYIVNSDLSFGATFIFERNTETITAEQIGETLEPYSVFLDKGLHYGLLQDWQGSGVHLSEAGISGFPLSQMGYGFGLQAYVGDFYADLSYVHSNGKIGEKDAIWYRFPSSRFNALLGWKGKSSRGTEHIARLDATYEYQQNAESVLDKVTSSGVTTRKIFGYNTILSRSTFVVTPSWKAVSYGCWEAAASISYSKEASVGSMMYPYINSQNLRSLRADCSALTYLGSFSAKLSLGFSRGFLDDSSRVSSTFASEPVQTQTRLAEYYDNWVWYNTAFCFNTGLLLRYDFDNGLYLSADGSFAIRKKMLRSYFGLSFGYTF